MSRRPEWAAGEHPGPRVALIPRAPAATNDAPDAIWLARSYGLTPDPWQDSILYQWLGRRADGKWCAGKCGVSVPRQNGKNGVLEVRELFGMVMLGEAILHTAHEVKTARKAFKRLKSFFGEKADDPDARYPELNALVADVRNTNGQEAIFLNDVWEVDGEHVRSVGRPRDEWGDHILDATFVAKGGSCEIAARSSGSGRGWTVDVLVLDEAQHLSDDEIEALLSTVSSAPLGNPQVIFLGTPPNTEKGQTGEVFTRVRGLVGTDERLSWTEFSPPDGPLPDTTDDVLVWHCNPALFVRLQMDVITDERGILSAEGVARERYGWWGDPGGKTESLFGEGRWAACGTEPLPPEQLPGVEGIGLGVGLGMDWTSFAASRVLDDGRVLLGPIQFRTPAGELVDRLSGTGTAPAEAKRLQDTYGVPVVLFEDCPDPNLAQALADEGVDVTVLSRQQTIEATSLIYEEIRDGDVVHERSRTLNAAVDAATWKPGDRFVLARRKSDGDISALEAAIAAHHAAAQELAYDIDDSLG